MAVYPLDFYRRAEAKWKRRAGTLGTEGGLPKKHGDSAPVRWPWLRLGTHSDPSTLPPNNLFRNVSWRS